MSQIARYLNRREAGQILAQCVRGQIGTPCDAVILALPRGGVPVGYEVARSLEAPLDVLVVRKLGVPGQEELAMGAITAGGFEILNSSLIAELGITPLEIAAVADREISELRRREELYRRNRPAVTVRGQTVILVDDGLATGFTMRAAIKAVGDCNPGRLIVAVPVGAPETCREISHEAGKLICPRQPDPFRAVAAWYRDFSPTTNEEVCDCLAAAARFKVATHHGS